MFASGAAGRGQRIVYDGREPEDGGIGVRRASFLNNAPNAELLPAIGDDGSEDRLWGSLSLRRRRPTPTRASRLIAPGKIRPGLWEDNGVILLDESFFTTTPQGKGSQPRLPVDDRNGGDETDEPKIRTAVSVALPKTLAGDRAKNAGPSR